MRALCGLVALCLTAVTISASQESRGDVGERARGAKKVVLATVADVESAFGENDFGDSLILSRVALRVEETMKGPHDPAIVLTIEGGTVGDLTLEVSDMPRMERGERAVVFVEESRNGGYVPHRRGSGVMKVDESDNVVDSDLTLEDIRAAVKAAQAQGN